MFGNKGTTETKVEKRSGPGPVPALVKEQLISREKRDADWVDLLRAVICKSPQGERAFDFRVFDQSDSEARKIQVKDYASLDGHPELIIYEGSFDEGSKRVELQVKKANPDTPLLNQVEIKQKVEGLSQPGSTAFFYMARGPNAGGPLGKGAAVIELNPNYPGKKQKKYILYTADVVDMQPVDKGQKLFDSDKPKQMIEWIASVHHKRMYE